MNSINLYLDLMKKSLTYSLWGEPYELFKTVELSSYLERFLYKLIVNFLRRKNLHILRYKPYDMSKRQEGKDHPALAHTMIGLKRLANIQFCVEDILEKDIPGDLIETGVWRGGATIFMRAILKAYDIKNRKVWVADSFQGLPVPDPEKYPADKNDKHYLMENLVVSLDEVKGNFAKYGLLDDQVVFLRGWFKETLPLASFDKFAVIRLDGDMYESTMDALQSLYPKLSIGGYVIIDDYGYIESCRQAVADYRLKHDITDEIITIDWTGAYWRKSG